MTIAIGVAHITLVTHVCNKNSNIQFAPSRSKFFPLREVPILKRDVIEENHCLIQKSPFGVGSFFSILAMPLIAVDSYDDWDVKPQTKKRGR